MYRGPLGSSVWWRCALIVVVCVASCCCALGCSDGTLQITGNKGRELVLDFNRLLPQYCGLDGGTSRRCSVVLKTEAKRGDIFADSSAGVEIHVDGVSVEDTPYCSSNVWAYVEDTYSSPSSHENPEGDISSRSSGWDWSDDYEGKRTAAALEAKYQSHELFDHFNISVYAPPSSASPVIAQCQVRIDIFNHRPVAESSTVVLRALDPWASVSTGPTLVKTFAFPRFTFLRATDPDSTEENPDEVSELRNISFSPISGGSGDIVGADFIIGMGNTTAPSTASRDEDDVYLRLQLATAVNIHAASFSIHFAAMDAEGATSATDAATWVTVVPSGSSLLPAPPLYPSQGGGHPTEFFVPRLFALPSVVVCPWLGAPQAASCNFALFGGDLLSTQVSMATLSPKDGLLEVDARELITPLIAMSEETDTEGNYRLTPVNASEASGSTSYYYPSSPFVTAAVHAVHRQGFTLSDVTLNSPPDVVKTSFRFSATEHATENAGGASKPSAADRTLYSPTADLCIFSPYLPVPALKCANITFRWSLVHHVPPASCGRSTEYDDLCTAADEASPPSISAVLDPFSITFVRDDLNRGMLFKDNDVQYVVTSIGVAPPVQSNGGAVADGGCVFHRTMFREIAVGDTLGSEDDLLWIPPTFEAHPTDAPLCSTRHAKVTIEAVVGSAGGGCQFDIFPPSTLTPPSSESGSDGLPIVVATESLYDATVVAEASEKAGLVTLPVGIHAAVEKALSIPARGSKSLPRATCALLHVAARNVLSHTIAAAYSNGLSVYPRHLITSATTSLLVPMHAFGIDAPANFPLDDQTIWVSHAHRHLAILVSQSNTGAFHPRRRVALTVDSTTLPSTGAGAIHVSVQPDINRVLAIRRSSVSQCGNSALGTNDAAVPSSEATADELVGLRYANHLQKYFATDPTTFAASSNRTGTPFTVIRSALDRKVAGAFTVFLASEGAGSADTIWFESQDTKIPSALRLAVTKRPKIVTLSTDAKLLDPWEASAQKRHGLQLLQFPVTTEGCSAVTIRVTASQESIDASGGISDGYADDELRVAFTDGFSVGPEVVLRIKIPKSRQGNDGFSDSYGAAASSMSSPLIIGCAVFIVVALVHYRKRIRRMVHRAEAWTSSDDEAPASQHRHQTVAQRSVLKEIQSMIATRASRASEFVSSLSAGSNGKSWRRLHAEDVAEERVELSAHDGGGSSSTAVVQVPRAGSPAETDEWDEWEEASCEPHPVVVSTGGGGGGASTASSASLANVTREELLPPSASGIVETTTKSETDAPRPSAMKRPSAAKKAD